MISIPLVFTTDGIKVTKTMRAIKHALTERFYTWQDAVEVAKSDPEINLDGGEGQVYNPSAYEEGYDEVDAAAIDNEASRPTAEKELKEPMR